MMGSPPSAPRRFVGFVSEVESYTELRGMVYRPATAILRYGALAVVRDERSRRSYLALVADVSERSLLPALDAKRLEEITGMLEEQGAGLADARRVLEALFSPSSDLIAWYSVREVKLRLLGQLLEGGDGFSLALPDQPPRPGSLIEEPDPQLLEQIVSRGLSGGPGLYMGVLAYNPGVSVYLDPRSLTTHAAVLGQTGSGKTETVKRLVAEYAWRKHEFSGSGGVVVFDVAGEYTGYPYQKPDAVPLLDAAVEPALFTEVQPRWLSSAKKTVLVLYDLSTLPLHSRAEVAFGGEVLRLVEYLARRYAGLQQGVKGLLFARHSTYLLEPGRPLQHVSRGQAARLLQEEPLLVVAAPLPDTVSVDYAVELSGSKSEYLPLVLAEVAERLRILGADTIESLTVLQEYVVMAWRAYLEARRAVQGGQAVSRAAAAVRDAVSGAARAAAAASPGGECHALRAAFRGRRVLGDTFISCRAWLYYFALPVAGSDPLAELDAHTVREALSSTDPETGATWRDAIAEGAEGAAYALLEHTWQTVASTVRGLKRASRFASPQLDRALYRLLVERVAGGFTVVHLAPPSRGDTDQPVSRLLEELFSVSVAGYSPDRRTLVVVEEAHNLAPPEGDKASKRALLRIAREGRKWGLSLVLVSQRPGFIDPDVLSQAATLIALRITNPDDLAGVRRSVESASQELVERLPDLEPGQAIISGLAVPERRIPLLTKVDMLAPRRERTADSA
jgi:DNA helicase HerA-like ATPase